MALNDKTERARKYLLGNLSDADQSRFEEDYFTDDELFEEMEIAEGELVDAYVHDELSGKELNNFEANLNSSPRLAQRVGFARTLAKSVSRAGSDTAHVSVTNETNSNLPVAAASEAREPFWRRLFPQPAGLGWAVATVTLLLVLGGGALFVSWMRLREESRRLALERAELQQRNQNLTLENEKQKSELSAQLNEARAENERLSQQLASSSNENQQAAPANRIVALLVFPGGLRSTGRRNVAEITPQTLSVRLRLALETGDYSQYAVAVKTVEQRTIWSAAALKPRTGQNGKVLELLIPSSKLPAGTYLVELSGFNDTSTPERLPDYSFQVVRKDN